MEPIRISAKLVNERVKFLCASEAGSCAPVMMDYVPPIGDGEGYLGLELLIMSFAGCVSTAVVGMLRRLGKDVASYGMVAAGTRRENPLSLERIDFEIAVESSDIDGELLERVIRRASELSPVWIAIRNNVEVGWRHSVAKREK